MGVRHVLPAAVGGILCLSLLGCSAQADRTDDATELVHGPVVVRLGLFDDRSAPAVSLPEKFGPTLSSLGEFDVRHAGTIDGEDFYIGRNAELICVVHGKGSSERDLEGGTFCNTPANTVKLGLYGGEVNADGSTRTVALVPDGCALEPGGKVAVRTLPNIQVMSGAEGSIRCPDGTVALRSPGRP